MTDLPTFDHEKEYWEQDMEYIAGVDEAGMGAWAGPVVAGAVIWKGGDIVEGVRDSKKVSPKKRETLSVLIQESALAWAVGVASVEEISELNIRGASHLAMRRAIDALSVVPHLMLIDGTPAQPHSSIPAVNIINGDAVSYSIAAASIIAKVHRDAIMCALDEKHPEYGFASHKGYGASAHQSALNAHGICIHHRPTYAPIARIIQNA